MNKLGLTLMGVLVLVIALIAGAWFWWSSSQKQAPVEQVQTSPSPDTTLTDNGDYYEITATYPSEVPLESEGANQKAATTIETFITAEVATFKEENNLLSLSTEDVEIQRLDERKYALDISYTSYHSAATRSYVFVIYADTLGAHPNAYYRTFTFDRTTGNTLSLDDLFSDTAYLEELSILARERLIAQIAEAQQTPRADLDTSFIDTGTEPTEANFAWFYLEDNALTLIFPPYQVGPWALGTQTVRLQKTELPSLLEKFH